MKSGGQTTLRTRSPSSMHANLCITRINCLDVLLSFLYRLELKIKLFGENPLTDFYLGQFIYMFRVM